MSPTARTLAYLRKADIPAGVVERWVPGANIRKDLFNCIDIIAIYGGQIVGIQATSGTNHARRLEKSIAVPELKRWLGASAAYEVWSWSKRTNGRWQQRIQQVTLDKSGRIEAMASHYPKEANYNE